MPLAAGLVGIIPALGLLTPEERPEGPVTFSLWELLAWCSALAFFGVFVAVPLRYQTIIREKLRFPSGTATASVIRTLHGLPPAAAEDEGDEGSCGGGSSGGGSNGGSNRAGPAAAGAWDGKSGVGLASDVEGQAAVSLQQQQQPGSGVGGLGGSGGSSSSKLLNQVDLEVAVWAVSCCCRRREIVLFWLGVDVVCACVVACRHPQRSMQPADTCIRCVDIPLACPPACQDMPAA